MTQLTPMMQQYIEIHDKVKDTILFFRLGDFYEMFFDDAILASKELGITLTARDCGLEDKAPMCGVPYHAAENYIAKLIDKGHKVAICEQIEDPKSVKGIVKRDIVKIITPGTILEGKLIENKNNNYLMCIYFNMVDFGLAYVDLSTGEFSTTELLKGNSKKDLLDEIAKISPTELIINTIMYKDKTLMDNINNRFNLYINVYGNKEFEYDASTELIKKQFNIKSLSAIGIEGEELSIKSCGGLLSYLNETQRSSLVHINRLNKYLINDFMAMDLATRSNLELTKTIRTQEKNGSLLGILDKTQTSMGGRKIKNWINEPLLEINEIQYRLDAVEYFTDNIMIRDNLKDYLKNIYDLDRLAGKLAMGNCNGRDLLSLKQSIEIIPYIKSLLISSPSEYIHKLLENLDDLEDVVDLIEKGINPDVPSSLKEGNIIRLGYNQEVDYYRELSTKGKEFIINLEIQEKERTGIKSLKIKYNKIFGYYIDVTKSNLELVPKDYIRKQTLANSERFYTEELKEIEGKILGAEEKLITLEYDIFQEIIKIILIQITRINKCSQSISTLDVLYSFGEVSFQNNYVKPIVVDNDEIIIYEGRHPVVEKVLPEQEFVPNSCEINCSNQRMIILTGPNMAGKSTFIRQVAIITLMAQIGCYVPAQQAKVGIVDRIFTRVGASDDLAIGHSTFMVEMNEVSNILKNATEKSLVILDEVGRGTSTYDGLSIAWSVVEYISNKDNIGCKTLFATHYHELTQLEDTLDGVKNFSIKVKETPDGVIFLRKIIRGGADQSYGIEVAKLAGIPQRVIQRAREILRVLEQDDKKQKVNNTKLKIQNKEVTMDSLNLFNYLDKQLMDELKELPIDEMTPLEVMNYVYNLKSKLKG